MQKTNTIRITEEFRKAMDLFTGSNKNLYVSGVAGTGKSTLLSLFLEKNEKNTVVLAPTGIAALNVGGSTIHSFFQFPLRVLEEDEILYRRRLANLFQKLETVIIDEISMVRADLLDAIDISLRLHRNSKKPFGGVQMVFFGDVMQLPPVVVGKELTDYFADMYGGPYFFNAHVFSQIEFVHIELTEIFRQKDEYFINILNKIRMDEVDRYIIDILNKNYRAEGINQLEDGVLTICTTNRDAASINDTKMKMLKTKPFTFAADIEGKFEEKFYPTDAALVLRQGTQVMMLRNDSEKRWVNGKIGIISQLDENILTVRFEEGEYPVKRHTWEMLEYVYNRESRKIESQVIGTFTQYPVVPAWAITIHKSQGQTFDRVNIHLGRGAFAHGQVYVALSRATSLSGITLLRRITMRDILVDPLVVHFVQSGTKFLTEG